MTNNKIDDVFVNYASEVLADTSRGLSGTQIVRYCNSYAVDFNVNIPITSPNFGDFGKIVPNKRTALYKNLREFNGKQQFVIIKELCELEMFQQNHDVQKLKNTLLSRFANFSTLPVYVENQPLSGWERVDRAVAEMKSRLSSANTEEQCQAIGMIARETLISVAQSVFIKNLHPTLDGIEASKTDAKRMLEAYLQYELSEASDKARKFAKSAVDFSNQLTHDRNATARDATMCYVAVTSVISLVKAIEDTK